jgi:hypothetical protein
MNGIIIGTCSETFNFCELVSGCCNQFFDGSGGPQPP